MNNRGALILQLLVALALMFSSEARAQQSSPSPTPDGRGSDDPAAQQSASDEGVSTANYNIISSVEIGVRGLGIDGSREKYYSDRNYRAGFRIFEGSLLVRAKENRGGLFDTLMVNSSGFGADPHGATRIQVEKTRWYRFDAQVRRNAYNNFINCCNLAQNYLTTATSLPTGRGLHTARTKHNMADFDLKLLPQNRNIRFNLGYSMDRYRGPATSTYNYARDTFRLDWNPWRSRSDEFRGGLEAKVGGLDLAFTQGYRYYRDDSSFIANANPGLDISGANATALTSYERSQPMRGRTWYSRMSAHTLIAKRLDITARYIYTHSRSRFTYTERAIGRGNLEGQNVIIDLNQVTSSGEDIERPTHLFDIGATWRVTDKLRISNTFRLNDFRIDGSSVYSDVRFLRRTTGAIFPPYPIALTLNPSRELEVRRWQNSLELDYDFGSRFAFFVGHRYIDRHLEETARQRVYPLSGTTATGNLAQARAFASEGEADNKTNGFFAGFKARPFPVWHIYLDLNRGQSDNAFTRLDNYDTFSFRVRNRITPRRGLSFNVSLITRDNNNPGVADEAILGLPEFDVDIKSRVLTSSVDWSPSSRFYLNTGYTYQHMTSDVGIIFLPRVGNPLTGRNLYYLRDHYFFVNTSLQVHPRLSLYAGYNGHSDRGQGDRATDDANGIFVRSFPMRFQSPEVRLILKLHRRVDWTAGYQYYDYKENFRNLFPDRYVNQDYRAHLPYTSLRFYFGGAER